MPGVSVSDLLKCALICWRESRNPAYMPLCWKRQPLIHLQKLSKKCTFHQHMRKNLLHKLTGCDAAQRTLPTAAPVASS